ncbi:enoyl-CoA hydratase/isomerase family protein [uncultured Sneathiella sp.]|uniref:enoyl-CoA hydratase/isomerase family protein n=1 Tax=uncultured Sneathiella sp. TaxID=879315 RepID=UPI0030ED15D5|tara:strand:- start:585 stop:1394 length:810 start_codon:yes stop_codon:yes gene_type:complete
MTDRYSSYNKLKFDYPADRVLRITFSNPETFNSVDAESHTQMTDIWRDIDRDPDINAVIVTGEGKAFSAGGDFGLIEKMTGNFDEIMKTWKEAKDLVYNIINCNKPIISAINGPAAGAGLVVGILADISIAGKRAKIVDGHPRLGVAAGDVAAIVWPLLCSMAKAKYYLLTCKQVSGEEAERIGLVSMCVEDDELQEAALGIAKDLAIGSQSAIRWTKYSLNNWLRQAGPIFDASTALEMLGFMGDDVKEGVASHREKRAPNFRKDCPI